MRPIFGPMMIGADLSGIQLRLQQAGGKTTVFDPVRKKWVVLTPEEHVRQCLIQYCINTMQYPASLMAVEKAIKVGSMNKRFDVVLYDRTHQPWLLAECKSPDVEITEKTLHQLLNYQRTIQGSYWLLTNGRQTYCADARDVQRIAWLSSLPAYDL